MSAAKKIIIVDDDIDYIESTKTVLEAKGYEVSYATTTKEGAEKIEKISPSLIILDVMMEKMSAGFDFSRKLKSDEKFKNIPILMVTGVGDETGFQFCTEAGDKAWLPVDGYIEKPIAPDKLISVVKEILG